MLSAPSTDILISSGNLLIASLHLLASPDIRLRRFRVTHHDFLSEVSHPIMHHHRVIPVNHHTIFSVFSVIRSINESVLPHDQQPHLFRSGSNTLHALMCYLVKFTGICIACKRCEPIFGLPPHRAVKTVKVVSKSFFGAEPSLVPSFRHSYTTSSSLTIIALIYSTYFYMSEHGLTALQGFNVIRF